MKTSKGIYKSLSVKVLLYILFLLIGTTGIYRLYQYDWSGFGEDSNKSKSIEKTIKDGKIISIKETEAEHFQSGKTLWDWLGLAGTLAIPIVLFQFQASEQRRASKRASYEKEQAEELAKVEKEQAEQREKFEKDIAEANLREEAFQAYIDRMSEILINKRNRSELFTDTNGAKNHTNADNPVRDIARIRTVTILRRLENDTERQNRILYFLHDTELLKFLLKTANLSEVDLSSVNLSGINLSDANLSGTNLSSTNLSSANLSSANLMGANLSNANLSDANLSDADLSSANLRGANLSDANLFGTNFTHANLANANLENSWIQDTKFINTDFSNAILVRAKTWDEEEIDCNYVLVNIEDEYCGNDYQYESYSTNFSEAILTNADLKFTNLKAAKNLTLEQLKEAKNWDEAIYNSELFKQLGLPKSLRKFQSEGEDIEKFIGSQVEVRSYTHEETKTITKGEITGFSKSKRCVDVKTLNGEQLDKLYLDEVYVYVT